MTARRARAGLLAAGLPLLVACSTGVSATVTAASAPGGPACAQDAGGQVCVTPGVAGGAASGGASSGSPGASEGASGAASGSPAGGAATSAPPSSDAADPSTTPSARASATRRPSAATRTTAAAPAPAGAWGGGHRVGQFTTRGTVAVTWRDQSYRGAVTGSCDVASDVRTAQVEVPPKAVLVIEVTSQHLAKITVGDGDGHTWSEEYVGDATPVIALGPQRLQVRKVSLNYENPAAEAPATVQADLDC